MSATRQSVSAQPQSVSAKPQSVSAKRQSVSATPRSVSATRQACPQRGKACPQRREACLQRAKAGLQRGKVCPQRGKACLQSGKAYTQRGKACLQRDKAYTQRLSYNCNRGKDNWISGKADWKKEKFQSEQQRPEHCGESICLALRSFALPSVGSFQHRRRDIFIEDAIHEQFQPHRGDTFFSAHMALVAELGPFSVPRLQHVVPTALAQSIIAAKQLPARRPNELGTPPPLPLRHGGQSGSRLAFHQRNVGAVEEAVGIHVLAEVGAAYSLTGLRLGLADIG
jgi:hypothetical protein